MTFNQCVMDPKQAADMMVALKDKGALGMLASGFVAAANERELDPALMQVAKLDFGGPSQ
jgi:hypothetical protein